MDILHHYGRSEAIEDGVLVDVTESAKDAGIRYPTALTRAAWCRYVEVPEGLVGQDEAARLWDILWMLRCRILASQPTHAVVTFKLYVQNDLLPPKLVTLKAICGPGDDAAPTITIMLPDED